MFRKALFSVLAALAIVLGTSSGASAAPGPSEEAIYCGPGMVQDGARCVVADPSPSEEQRSAWEALVFGGLAVVFGIGTAIVGH